MSVSLLVLAVHLVMGSVAGAQPGRGGGRRDAHRHARAARKVDGGARAHVQGRGGEGAAAGDIPGQRRADRLVQRCREEQPPPAGHEQVRRPHRRGLHVQVLHDGGVLDGDCDTVLNHAITAVGYGTARDGTKYWLMKNSWGKSWGEGGYVRIRRGEGVCGLAKLPSFPV